MGEFSVAAAAGAWETLRRSPAFWDVDPAMLDPARHADWIIARILQFGRWEDWVALFHGFPADQIRQALGHRRVPDHVRRFWEAYFAHEGGGSTHPDALAPGAAALWQHLGPALCPPGCLLGGGTALALYLGHRQSDDLDFLTMTPGDPAALITRLQSTGTPAEVVDRGAHGVHLRVRGVQVSYLWKPGVRLDRGETFEGIPLASLPTLAALKCNAVANRGARKDFVDLYALVQSGWSLAQILDAAQDLAPGLNLAHLLRSLTYFEDANRDPDLRLFHHWPWETVRHTLEQQVQTYLRQRLPRPDPPKLQP